MQPIYEIIQEHEESIVITVFCEVLKNSNHFCFFNKVYDFTIFFICYEEGIFLSFVFFIKRNKGVHNRFRIEMDSLFVVNKI